ncbi:hypothetical protein MKJ01_06540 [Chryseobacterium sp. SSA4.19]|uniref:hypothetical protein n=1 Tax=Chryseobacterium sp. SSA4.19 TaxID=2919915 RepID=UPI001F4E615D|nr:hypothetical protein [Chryseobacterium sp. SSA4.19]MCJ8153420.1 hypothetical protein [Chryseobacterium sp. SSA4.19]
MAKTEILFHKNELESTGIEIIGIDETRHEGHIAHRDEHFILILQKKGKFFWELDFREVIIRNFCLLCCSI